MNLIISQTTITCIFLGTLWRFKVNSTVALWRDVLGWWVRGTVQPHTGSDREEALLYLRGDGPAWSLSNTPLLL